MVWLSIKFSMFFRAARLFNTQSNLLDLIKSKNVEASSKALKDAISAKRFPRFELMEYFKMCARERNRSNVGNIKTLLQENHMRLDVRLYNLLMSVHVRCFDKEGAKSLFEDMKLNDRSPNSYTFNLIGAAYSQIGDVANMDQLLKEMVDGGVEMSPAFLDLMLNAALNSKNYDKGIQLYREWGDKVEPNTRIFTALIRLLIDGGDLTGAKGVFNVMKQKPQTKPNRFTYSAFMKHYIEKGNVEEADNLLHEMILHKIEIRTHTLNGLMAANLKSDREKRTEELFGIFEREGIERDLITYSLYLQGLFAMGKVEAAEKLALEIKEKFAKLDVVYFVTMIKGYRLNGDLEKALGNFEELKNYGLQPNLYAYSSILKGLLSAKDKQNILKIITEITTSRAVIDLELYQLVTPSLEAWDREDLIAELRSCLIS